MEYSWSYSETAGSSWFYSNKNIANSDSFNSFKYQAKLLENTVAQPTSNVANGIWRNAIMAKNI